MLPMIVRPKTKPFIEQVTKYATIISIFIFQIRKKGARPLEFDILRFLYVENSERIAEVYLPFGKYFLFQ